MNIEPDKKILKITKTHSVIASGFLAMGLSSFLITHSPVSIFPMALSVPFLIINLATHLSHHKKNYTSLGSHLFQFHYKQEFKNWFNNYIDKSKSLTEKKYKLIFISMWMKARHLKSNYLLDMYPDKIEHISNELSKRGGAELRELFMDRPLGVSYRDFFEEDKYCRENQEIAKQVYQDFAAVGFVGKYFKYWSASEMLCLIPLQEYKLSAEDITEIKKVTNENKRVPDLFRHNLFFTELSENYCVKIINENLEHLKTLKEFFLTMREDNQMKMIVDMIIKTEKSATISQHLQSTLPVKTDSIKIKKI